MGISKIDIRTQTQYTSQTAVVETINYGVSMYRVTGYFTEQKVVRYFTDVYDAIDFKDIVDANYPLKVTFEKGVYPVRSFIVDSWNAVMNS